MSNVENNASQDSAQHPCAPAVAGLLLALFWLSLGLAGCLCGWLILAPPRLELEQLRLRYLKNGLELKALEAETDHLSRIVHALRHDADFRNRVAAAELKSGGTGGLRLEVGPELEYDARQRERLPPPAPFESAWYLPLLTPAASPGQVRTRLTLAAAGLLLLAFACFHEGFFTGALGSWLLRAASRAAGRYRVKKREPPLP